MKDVKAKRRRGRTRLSAKNQATIPVEALRKAGLKPGDELRVEAAGAGRIVLIRDDDIIERYAGALPDVYSERYLEDLRDEWP
ncbi:MAG TPA: AbrB/MazE/SpoVT family DNA-binding domain-containing protein [Actinomycetota bacterium]|nr:AbrB/MazE/SpoVT family DNA-binding domain-containing protein [Actinomycetota bacterium]